MKGFVMILALSCAAPTASLAQEEMPESSAYVGFRIGPIIPMHDDMDGFDNGLALEAALGFNAGQNVALEFGVGRFGMGASESGYMDIGGYLYPATISLDLVAYSVTGTAKLVIPVDKARFYGLLGGGMYFISADAELDVEGYGSDSETFSESSFGFHVGGGMDFLVTPKVRFGAEVKYVIGEVDLYDTGDKNHYDSITFSAALAYGL